MSIYKPAGISSSAIPISPSPSTLNPPEHHLNNHLGSTTNPTHPVPSAADIQLAPSIPLGGTASQATPYYVAASASPSSCAIQECNRQRHVDDDGTVHECCGYTHAMEMSRRKNVKSKLQKSITEGLA